MFLILFLVESLAELVQVLPILRSLHKIYGPISVIHFDAHLVSLFFHSSTQTLYESED